MLSQLQPTAQPGNQEFLTFSDPFQATDNCTQQRFLSGAQDSEQAAARLLKLLSGESPAFRRSEIERLIASVCTSAAFDDVDSAITELCLEASVLSGSIGRRLTVWFDSHLQRLNLRTEDGKTDCMSLAGMLTNRI